MGATLLNFYNISIVGSSHISFKRSLDGVILIELES